MDEINSWATLLTSKTRSGNEVLATGIFYVISSLILVIMILGAKAFAEKVANVSMDGAMGGAIGGALNPIGQLAAKPAGWAAGKAAKYGGKAAWAGTKAAGRGAWAGTKAGGRAAYSGAKRMYERMRNEA